MCINGRSVYITYRKPLKAGREKTEAYIDSESRLDSRFYVVGFQVAVWPNGSAHTAILQSLRFLLSITACRKWNFRVTGVSRSFLKSKTLEMDI